MTTRPGRVVKVRRRGENGVERIVYVGIITEEVPEGDHVRVGARTVEWLVTNEREPAFPPPLQEFVREPKGFIFWWKQLDYVFGLPDPTLFPPLPQRLTADDNALVERFVHVATQLAGSALLNAVNEGFNVSVPNPATGPEKIEGHFSGTDIHAGFAGLLRQCDSPKEPAHFHRVHRILAQALEGADDGLSQERLRYLTAWKGAVGKLHGKSLNQLLREKFVREEGATAFAYEEEYSPEKLLSVYNYGDLLHYDKKKSAVLEEWRRDEIVESDRRVAYLMAAAGLGHVYVGFGEVARRALAQVEGS